MYESKGYSILQDKIVGYNTDTCGRIFKALIDVEEYEISLARMYREHLANGSDVDKAKILAMWEWASKATDEARADCASELHAKSE